MQTRVLIVDDDSSLASTLVAVLNKRGYLASFSQNAESALERLSSEEFDVVMTDLKMKGVDGLELCRRIVSIRPDLPVIVMTAFGSLDTAVGAIRAGAFDFLTKPVETEVLFIAVNRAASHRELRQEVRRLREQVQRTTRLEGLIGTSPTMERVRELLARVSDSEATVLVTGESGTGKEVVARALHENSRRRAGPFVPVNCAAMPEQLLESELFGHIRGAFTDARGARKGLFQQADGGTLFLDEVGELPIALQPKLLRVLQDHQIRPVGSDTEIRVDVRVVAATNRDLELAIEDKRFREDLFYRLNVIPIALPPLRARGNDVLQLAQQFLARYSTQTGKQVLGLSPEAAKRMLSYNWPGNVRELQNAMERAVALTRFDTVTLDDLPEKVVHARRSSNNVAADETQELVPMEEVERRHILRVLEAVGGNKSLAAQTLGMDRKTLYRKLEKFGEHGASPSVPPSPTTT